ncbi:MAG: 2-C-methyl-D-erythritol 4-phosphate cytidylyltransferase [Bacillota bacterium]|nr:2-C-methyl-D-erythritol 4-phosphate cytidylyltransferase [Bacillota bacterium]
MYEGKRVAAVIAAAGAGSRMGGGVPKQYLELEGAPVLGRTLAAFVRHPAVDEIYIAIREEDRERCRDLVREWGCGRVTAMVAGGAERQDSVFCVLKEMKKNGPLPELVLVQDAARPFVSGALISRVLKAAAEEGAAVPGLPVRDTVKRGKEGVLHETVDRRGLFTVQTPQGFQTGLLLQAYETAEARGFRGTDDAALAEGLGRPAALVEGEARNIKLTTPEDMAMAAAFLKRSDNQRPCRMGTGLDAHAFAPGRKLILGGVEIPFEKGLAGHSDADVLTHAVADAVLGACALGDIGRHFPDTDPAYKGVSSLKLLEQVKALAEAAGFVPGNVDVTLIGQRPKIAPHAREMEENLARALGVAEGQINVKATTTEGMGFTGREEGLAAQAVAVVYDKPGTGIKE